MKVLAFAASTSRQSINRKLIGAAAEMLAELKPGVEVEVLDLVDYEMPIYCIDRENEGGVPEPAQRLHRQIGEADAVLISFAEHNGAYTAAFKSIFDWTSRIDSKVYQGKPTVLMAASPGGRGGANVLQLAAGGAPHFGADLRGTFSLGRFYDIFDVETNRPKEADKLSELEGVLSSLVAS